MAPFYFTCGPIHVSRNLTQTDTANFNQRKRRYYKYVIRREGRCNFDISRLFCLSVTLQPFNSPNQLGYSDRAQLV